MEFLQHCIKTRKNKKLNIRIVLIESEQKTIEKGFSIDFGKSLIIVGSPPLMEGANNNAIHITGISPIT